MKQRIKSRGSSSSLARSSFSVLATAAMLALATAGQARSPADTAEVEAKVKVAFVYNFARFVEWPQNAAHGSVKIAVIGRGDLGAPLEQIVRGKTVNGKSLEVTRVAAASPVPQCDILLIERSEIKRVKEIVQSLGGKPVLTVGDDPTAIKEGAIIAFLVVDESVRFQINQEAAGRAGLKISSQLLKVALPAGGNGQ